MARTRPDDRLERLVDAGTNVVIESRGFRRMQMADVAKRMGVATGTVYLYVESKEALFDLVARAAGGDLPEDPPLPWPTPAPGATVAYVAGRVAEMRALPALEAALAADEADDLAREVAAIAGEIYDVLAANRVAIKLIERCAVDYPDLAAVWYGPARFFVLGRLVAYRESPIRRDRWNDLGDARVAARLLIETCATFAVHIRWDPSPQEIDDAEARRTVVRAMVHAFVKE